MGKGAPTPKDHASCSVGDVIRSHGRTVTEADIVNFAGISGDFHGAHLDVERMKNSPYGKPIAHGDLILSLALGLLWQVDQRANVVDGAFDRIRFPNPTFAGDTITAAAELTRLDPGKNAHETWSVTVSNQRGQVVCAFVRTLQTW